MRLIGIALEGVDEASQRRDPLRAHGISFVCHCGRAYLLALEWLLHLAKRLEHANVAAELCCTGGDSRYDRQHECIELPRVRLPSHWQRSGERHPLRHELIETANFLVISLEQLEEAGLCSRRSLHAAEWKRPPPVVDVCDVENEVLHPERRSFADRSELRRLQMRVAQGRLVAPLFGEGR